MGYGAVRMGVFRPGDMPVMGKFVMNFAMPALIFKALSQRAFQETLNVNYLLVYASATLTVMFIGVTLSWVRRKGLRASTLYGMGMSFSNSGFIGYPIVLQLIGDAASVALALNFMVENLLLLPIIFALLGNPEGSPEGTGRLAPLLALLKNPLILAILAGFGVSVLALPLPGMVNKAVDLLAMAPAPVALFVIGGNLVGLRIRGMMMDVGQIMIGKLVLHPLAMFAALMLAPPFDPKLQMAAMAFASVPMLSIYPIIGQRYGQERICTAAMVVTTAVSFLTISGILWAMETHGLQLPEMVTHGEN